MSLTILGEDRQKKNRVGVEMQSLQVVMEEDREEKLRKGRHQTGSNGAYEERIEGVPSGLRKGGAGLEHLRPVDALRRHHPAHPGKARLQHVRRVQGGRVSRFGRGLARRHVLLGRAIEVDLKISEAERKGARKRIWPMTGGSKGSQA